MSEVATTPPVSTADRSPTVAAPMRYSSLCDWRARYWASVAPRFTILSAAASSSRSGSATPCASASTTSENSSPPAPPSDDSRRIAPPSPLRSPSWGNKLLPNCGGTRLPVAGRRVGPASWQRQSRDDRSGSYISAACTASTNDVIPASPRPLSNSSKVVGGFRNWPLVEVALSRPLQDRLQAVAWRTRPGIRR